MTGRLLLALLATAGGDPTFAPAGGSPHYVGPMAGRPVLADMNGDSKPDVVIACGTCCGSKPDPESGIVVVLLGDGKGGFARVESGPVRIGPSARKVAVGDVNGDRKPDVVVGEHDSASITVWLGDGKGGLKAAPFSPVKASDTKRPHTHDVALADVDGDGHLDLLSTNANDGTVSILKGDGSGQFAPAPGSPVSAARHPYDSIAVVDVNGDAKPDLVVPDLRGNAVSVLLGQGGGAFGKPAQFPLGPRPGYIVVGDVNGDRKPDLVATHDDDPLVAILLGDGAGRFAPAEGSPLKLETPVWGSALGDLDGDGKADLAIGANGDRGLEVLLGDGKGGFRPSKPIPAPRMSGYVAIGDVDGDAKPDLVAASYETGEVTVWLRK
jgi:hypothetical protein